MKYMTRNISTSKYSPQLPVLRGLFYKKAYGKSFLKQISFNGNSHHFLKTERKEEKETIMRRAWFLHYIILH